MKYRGAGSSPLTRGKRLRLRRLCGLGRLIPAHAGKTGALWPVIVAYAAHPRSRGENLSTYQACVGRAGSSPLTRGKLPSRLAPPYLVRLIPAHAGKTATASAAQSTRKAHPRSRGENLHAQIPADYQAGSSPLTRGKRRQHEGSQRPDRLIPAHAGKTSRCAS